MADEQREVRGFKVRGRVQGVFFRVWTRDTAMGMGLRGTVRNLPEGSVEVWVEGEPRALDLFEARLWEGPRASKVEGVEKVPGAGALPEAGFLILH